MRKTISLTGLAIAVAVITAGFSTRAKADTSSWAIDRCNIATLCAPGTIGTVDLATSGSGASEVIDVTATAIAGYGFFGQHGAFGFNFDGNDAGVGITNVNSPFSFNGGSGQMDGFGSFEFILDGTGGSGATSPLSFTVTCAGGCTSVSQLAGELSGGGSGSTYFVAHVRNNSSGLTGFAGADPVSNPVPEPGSLALLGSGLLGLAGAVRRRLIG